MGASGKCLLHRVSTPDEALTCVSAVRGGEGEGDSEDDSEGDSKGDSSSKGALRYYLSSHVRLTIVRFRCS